MNLNRTEELDIKKDIKGIRKALENIAHNLSPASTDTESADTESRIPDPFFGKIHMSYQHMKGYDLDYNTRTLKMIALVEECSELQQALTKMYKAQDQAYHSGGDSRANVVEEMAHVMICIKCLADDLGITADDIQQEIYKKYPDGYNLTAYMAENKPYYVERTKGSE